MPLSVGTPSCCLVFGTSYCRIIGSHGIRWRWPLLSRCAFAKVHDSWWATVLQEVSSLKYSCVAAQPLAHGHTFLPRHAGLNAIPFGIGLVEKLSELSRRTSERDKSVGCPPSTFGWRWLAAASSRVSCQPFIYSATWDSIAAGCAAGWSHCFNNGGTGAAFAIASCGRKPPTHQLLCQSPAAKAVS